MGNRPLVWLVQKNYKRDGSTYDIYTDGLKVYTTIDSRMQQYAEQAVYTQMGKTCSQSLRQNVVHRLISLIVPTLNVAM